MIGAMLVTLPANSRPPKTSARTATEFAARQSR
jgi:hypothetical protein